MTQTQPTPNSSETQARGNFQVLDTQAGTPVTVNVTYDGKVHAIPFTFTQDDETLRQLLAANGLTGAANALVERQADGSIQLVKRGGPNGALTLTVETIDEAVPESDVVFCQEPDVIQILVQRLSQLQPHINPAVQCDWELRRLEWSGQLQLTQVLMWQGVIDKAIADGKAEAAIVRDIESRLGECLSVPDQTAPGLM